MSLSKDLVNIIKKTQETKTSPYDTQAEVVRVEGGTAWVHIPGGVDETPVRMTINARQGDTVQVRVANGTAFLVGNGSAPPTDDHKADIATSLAYKAQETAEEAVAGVDGVVQYFWHDANGAHITEIPQKEFVDNPSGGNLLAKSTGIAIRDGLTDVSTFSADEIHLGTTVGTRKNGAKITQDSFVFTPPFGSSSFVYREKSGTAEIEQRYKGTGSALAIELLRGESLLVTVDGVQTTNYILNYSQSEIYGTLLFSSPYPASGSDIVVSYTVSSSTIYELGIGTSSAPFGIVEGLHCTASGIFAHAEGNRSTASGAFSHAEGFDSKARGSHSHAQNYGTIASGLGQTSLGLYNIEDTNNEYALLIGNGTEGARSNALAVDWNGNVRIKGTVYAGCNNDSTGGKALPVSVDITSGADLNSYMNYGNYACGSGAIAQSLSNCPTTVNFSMLVLPKYENTLVTQIIFAAGNQIYTRTNTSGGWGGWYKFTGTAV